MNSLDGRIHEIVVDDHLTQVKILVDKIKLSTVVIDTPDTAPYLVEGEKIKVVFKESEVVIGKGKELEVSLQNKIPGTIKDVHSSKLLSKVIVDTPIGVITSIITTNAVKTLSLDKGVQVFAMVKSNEIILSHA